jgi:putative transposase
MRAPDRRAMLDRADGALSLRRQCALLGVARSGVYRSRKPANDNGAALMRRIDELFTAWPFLGARRMTAMLRAEGVNVNRKRVQRLMRPVGIAALGPKPRTSKPAPGHKIYPSLACATRRSSGRTTSGRPTSPFIPIGRGFLYLVAIIDWASRAVLAQRLSNTMDVSFCLAALKEALARFGSDGRRFSTPTRARSSLRRPSPAPSPKPASRSPWTAAAAGWTTYSSSGCGGR